MPRLDEIADFVCEQTGHAHVTPTTRLVEDTGADGDDMFELMERYSERFDVDLSTYRWYFHHGEEGGWCSFGGLFFAPPYKRVQHMPITVAMLHQFAEQKRWGIQYPDHKLPKRRIDMLINQILSVVVLSWIGYALWRTFTQ